MVVYLIKSTISLIAFYGFFHFFLRSHKVLLFNRFYLISSLVFSLLIPLVKIPVKSFYVLSTSIDKVAFIANPNLQSEQILSDAPLQHLTPNTFLVLLIIISSFLAIRFFFNIVKITKKVYDSERIKNPNITLVLVNEKILPYSFFSFIFLNKADFENGKIEIELINHEEAHCLQYHSIDIILLELINIFLWFNPVIWLFRRALRLNHEYYADNRVLTQTDSTNYYQLLVNLLTQNSTNILVSNFKYSLIKNRIIMMTNERPLSYMILKKFSAIILFLVIGIIVSFSQRTIDPNKSGIEKKVVSFSQQTVNPNKSGIENKKKPQILNATSVAVSDNIMIFQGNVRIRIPGTDSTYSIIKTDSAIFDKEKNIYSAHLGTVERFVSGNTNPFEIFSFDGFRFNVDSSKAVVKNLKGLVRIKEKK